MSTCVSAIFSAPRKLKNDFFFFLSLSHVDNPAREIEKPLKSANMREIAMNWDVEFIKAPSIEDDDMLFDLIMVAQLELFVLIENEIFLSAQAANYLDFKSLLELGCAKVATEIKGKSVEQVRARFGIVNDFSPELRTRGFSCMSVSVLMCMNFCLSAGSLWIWHDTCPKVEFLTNVCSQRRGRDCSSKQVV